MTRPANIVVRTEQAGDIARALEVQRAAFQRPDTSEPPPEPGLVEALRASDDWIPDLVLVAEVDGEIAGHVVTSRGAVVGYDGAVAAGLGLGPIGVDPPMHGVGVGTALMHESIRRAEVAGESFIALLGDPGYYQRFGFVASTEVGIAPPDDAWGPFFQVRPLVAADAIPTGRFRYAAPFDGLD